MENFNYQNYRNNLAKELKAVHKDSPEKTREVLKDAQKTEEYKNAESRHKRLKEWEKEAKIKFAKNADLIEEVNNEMPHYMDSSENEGLERLVSLYEKYSEIIRKRGKGPEPNGLSRGTFEQNDIFDGRYFNRDYGKKYGSDYPGEFSWGQKHHHERKLIYEKLGLFSESNNNKRIEHLENILTANIPKPHEAFRIIETLSLSGISGELLDKLKNAVLVSANANVLRKTLEEFPINFSQEELHTALQNAFDKKSVFDVSKIIEMIGEENINSVVIEKRNSLLEDVKEKFLENRKTLEQGVKNKDFLLHFSGIPNIESILAHGILSNLDQDKYFSNETYGMGEGNDLQRITGRLDGISVLDAFKGANRGEKDSQLFKEMKEKIQNSVDQFLKEKYDFNPANLFDFRNQNNSIYRNSEKLLKINEISDGDLDKFRKKYSKILTISDVIEERIDPNEKNEDGGYHKFFLNRNWGEIRINYINYPDDKSFKPDFFRDWTDDKQELMTFIKKIMKDTYIESNQDEENKKDNLKYFERVSEIFVAGRNSAAFILDPSLERIFVQSIYDGESMVEGSIPPEKILGAFVNNTHLERACYNNGMVVFDYKKKEEVDESQKNNILFETPNGAIIVKDLYR